MRSSKEAAAQSHLYTLCQSLYLEGITAASLPIVHALPELVAALPTVLNLDELAAAHHDLFGFNLFPYESVFLGQEQVLGSAISEVVSEQYQRYGYYPPHPSDAFDHIGQELGLLAHLCAVEGDAIEDNQQTIAQRMAHAQRMFLEGHLLRWLMPLVVAVRRHENAFFAEIAMLTVALVAEHYSGLVRSEEGDKELHQISVASDSCPPLWQLPDAPALVADPKTSLHDIALFLTTPVYSGFYLSRFLINQLGRRQRLPRGFGGRVQMLTNLLRTAAQYEAVPVLVQALREEVAVWRSAYQAAANGHPILLPFIQPWLVRSSATAIWLAEMERLIYAQATQ